MCSMLWIIISFYGIFKSNVILISVESNILVEVAWLLSIRLRKCVLLRAHKDILIIVHE